MQHANIDQAAVEVFLKSWQLYQQIIENNYMFHREISDAVRDSLISFRPNKKLSILDLGCGDGSMTLRLLPPERIGSYIACDLSQPALEIAHRQIDALAISAKLICDDMLNVASEQPDQSLDLVFSSYAIHHLSANNKQLLIEQISRALTPDGRFVLIDIFREPSEDRAAYMRHYMGRIRESWTNLTVESQALVVNHATEYDYPEPPEFFHVQCIKAGLGNAQALAKNTWHEAWIYAKESSQSLQTRYTHFKNSNPCVS